MWSACLSQYVYIYMYILHEPYMLDFLAFLLHVCICMFTYNRGVFKVNLGYWPWSVFLCLLHGNSLGGRTCLGIMLFDDSEIQAKLLEVGSLSMLIPIIYHRWPRPLPSLKLTYPLKMDGWNTTFLLGRPIFRGEPLVSGRVLGLLPLRNGKWGSMRSLRWHWWYLTLFKATVVTQWCIITHDGSMGRLYIYLHWSHKKLTIHCR